MPGHARSVECQGGKGERKFRCVATWYNFPQTIEHYDHVSIWLSTKPERYRMKRLIEWLNLIAALIRLADVISRSGWF